MKRVTYLFGYLLLAAALLSGCSAEISFAEKHYEADPAEVRAINVDVRDRAIEVAFSEDGQLRIDYAESETEGYAIDVSADGILTMKTEENKTWKDYFGGNGAEEDRKITIWLPEDQLDALELTTSREDITLPGSLSAGRISLKNTDGDVSFEKLSVGESLELDAKNGDIRGTIVGGYDDFAMTCTVKKGECNLPAEKQGGEKTLTLSVNNGDAEIEFIEE